MSLDYVNMASTELGSYQFLAYAVISENRCVLIP